MLLSVSLASFFVCIRNFERIMRGVLDKTLTLNPVSRNPHVATRSTAQVLLQHTSPDMDEGFPGTLTARVGASYHSAWVSGLGVKGSKIRALFRVLSIMENQTEMTIEHYIATGVRIREFLGTARFFKLFSCDVRC